MSARTIDFLGGNRTPWLGWCLFAAGVCAMAMSVWIDRRWSAERIDHEVAQRQREEAMDQARVAALRPVTPTLEEQRLQRIAPQLRQPWLPVLRVIENVTEPPVFLLAMSVDPATGAVRLDGEASSFGDALAYSKALDDESVLGPAQLRSHDAVSDQGSGRQSVRFSIVTRWMLR